MGKMQCDVCGGPLAIDAGGRSATCKNCGMEHSIERVREMLGTASAAQPDGWRSGRTAKESAARSRFA